MTKKLFFLLTTILSVKSYAQISFEKGYFIDNSGQKTECLIKNIDWKNNPTEFQYKLTETDSPKTGTLASVKEFGVSGISKFIRATVKIDKSDERIGSLSSNKAPEFQEEQLFLKVLIEGKASLYHYENGNLRCYFFKTDTSDEIRQLVYKKYLAAENKIGENIQYKQQLWQSLKCDAITMRKVETLEYRKNSLINLFTKYNSCTHSEFVSYKKNNKRMFHLTLRPGLKFSSLSIDRNQSSGRKTDFDNEPGFRFGLEGEFVLPFNKNKWSVLIEPTYQYYKSEKTIDADNVSGGKLTTSVDYKSIEIPLSVRHYFFLDDNSKLFANLSVVFNADLDSSIDFTRSDDSSIYRTLETKSNTHLALGLGYKYNNKYSLELRYQSRSILNYVYWDSNYKSLSVIVGYTIF